MGARLCHPSSCYQSPSSALQGVQATSTRSPFAQGAESSWQLESSPGIRPELSSRAGGSGRKGARMRRWGCAGVCIGGSERVSAGPRDPGQRSAVNATRATRANTRTSRSNSLPARGPCPMPSCLHGRGHRVTAAWTSHGPSCVRAQRMDVARVPGGAQTQWSRAWGFAACPAPRPPALTPGLSTTAPAPCGVARVTMVGHPPPPRPCPPKAGHVPREVHNGLAMTATSAMDAGHQLRPRSRTETSVVARVVGEPCARIQPITSSSPWRTLS